MTCPEKLLRINIEKSIQAKKKFLDDLVNLEKFVAVCKKVLECYKKGGRIYIAGNGGSAADSQHLAAEFVARFAKDRSPLPAEALTVDPSVITAIGNDYGYEQIFSRQVEAKVSDMDIFLGITTSGNSENIIQALKVCKAKKIPSIVFLGNDGGKAKDFADFPLIINDTNTAAIQEAHILLAHTICEYIENTFFKDQLKELR